MIAVIQANGKQYRVEEGKRFCLDIPASGKKEFVFDSVLLYENGADVRVGNPLVKGVKVTGKVVEEGKGEKVRIYKYRRRKRTRVNKGHRQPYTEIEVTAIVTK